MRHNYVQTVSCSSEAMPHSASDLELVRAAQSGQGHAFATLVQRTQGMARAIAYSATGDYDSAEDLAQEALVTAWTRLADLEEPAKFRPWLAGIVRNCARYYRRHRGRHAPIAHEGLDVIEAMASADLSPLDALQHKESWQRASAALRVLPSRDREPLLLYYTLDESHANVAGALGMTEAAVRQRLCRARKKLRDELGPAETSGKRLASSASAAATVMLMIHSRQAWAAPLTASAAPMSPKLFIGLGAATGGALIACTAALILLLGARDSPSAIAAERDRSRPHPAMTSTSIAREPGPPGHSAQPSMPQPQPGATVRIGSGKVKAQRPQREQPLAAQRPQREQPLAGRVSSGGRIRKHGPARLEIESNEPGPMLRPSLSIADVQRELWSTD